MSWSFSPEWSQDLRVDEEGFAHAYQGLTDWHRALLKTCIARNVARLGDFSLELASGSKVYRQGFSVFHNALPFSGVVIAVAAEMQSPARLLAAVLPAVLAGAADLTVLLSSAEQNRSDVLLPALELAGCEQVLLASGTQTKKYLREAAAKEVMVVFMGRPDAGLASLLVQRVAVGRARLLPGNDLRVGLWWDAGDPLDLEAVAWSHPDVVIEPWNLPSKHVPGGWSPRQGSWEACLEARYDALFVPSDKVSGALGHCPLVLGPGHEGAWAWPTLEIQSFWDHGLGLAASGNANRGG